MDILRNILDEYKDIALSDLDIRDLMGSLGYKFNVIPYSEIKNYKSIEDLLGPDNICFILYEWKKGFGHWCLILRSGDLIEFFDPYGSFPDSQLELIKEPFRTESGQTEKALSKLFLEYDGDLSYNEFPFQTLDKGIKTCGRWVILRAYLKDMPLKEFKKLFMDIYGDDIVTILTS